MCMFSSSASAHGHALILPALMICHDIDGICLPLCNTTIGTSSDCVKMRRLVAKRIHEGYHIEKTIYIYIYEHDLGVWKWTFQSGFSSCTSSTKETQTFLRIPLLASGFSTWQRSISMNKKHKHISHCYTNSEQVSTCKRT